MKIAIVTDAWSPQVNGVVNTLKQTTAGLQAMGHEVNVITPEGFRTLPMPTDEACRRSRDGGDTHGSSMLSPSHHKHHPTN